MKKTETKAVVDAPQVEAVEPVVKTDTVQPKFTAQRLRESHLMFGVSTSTYDAATYGLEGEYTVEEMRKHIKEWLKKEVK